MADRKRKKSKRVRHLFEYALLRSFEFVLRRLPFGLARAVAQPLGYGFYMLSGLRQTCITNIQQAYGDTMSLEEVRQMTRKVFRNVARSIIELLWLRDRLPPERMKQLVTLHGAEKVHQAFERGKGVLLITGHLGNWELGGHALAQEFGSLSSVARPLKNVYVDRYLLRIRLQHGQHIIDRTGALRELIGVLRENRLVVMLIDQHARRGGIPVEFFGKEAWTITAPATIAVRMGCPVVLGYCYRDPDGIHHHVVADEIVEFAPTDDRQADVRRATRFMTKKIESYVRKHPDQWFWLHRRWKLGHAVETKGADDE